MKLLHKPFKPRHLPVVSPLRIDEGDLPERWQPYCEALRVPLSA